MHILHSSPPRTSISGELNESIISPATPPSAQKQSITATPLTSSRRSPLLHRRNSQTTTTLHFILHLIADSPFIRRNHHCPHFQLQLHRHTTSSFRHDSHR
ncbi:unnamed protein product [Lathyrus oleraceus]